VSTRIITLLTDFGTDDYFVGAMKGVILARSPNTALIDITHSIPPHDVQEGAFTLGAGWSWFPAGSIHLAVVDPGVGSARRPALLEAGTHLFVGPDNGLFTLILDKCPTAQMRHLTNSAYFLPDAGATFHGRDIFAPVAAALAEGVPAEEFGPIIQNPVRLTPIRFTTLPDGTLAGRIIHIDHFGNCVTNLPSERLSGSLQPGGFAAQVKEFQIRKLARSYADFATSPSEAFLIHGSAGFLEISLYASSARQALALKVGDPVRVVWDKSAN
jgi:S-adenosyl-L-methionine hydrolase (adenosine-forming)